MMFPRVPISGRRQRAYGTSKTDSDGIYEVEGQVGAAYSYFDPSADSNNTFAIELLRMRIKYWNRNVKVYDCKTKLQFDRYAIMQKLAEFARVIHSIGALSPEDSSKLADWIFLRSVLQRLISQVPVDEANAQATIVFKNVEDLGSYPPSADTQTRAVQYIEWLFRRICDKPFEHSLLKMIPNLPGN